MVLLKNLNESCSKYLKGNGRSKTIIEKLQAQVKIGLEAAEQSPPKSDTIPEAHNDELEQSAYKTGQTVNSRLSQTGRFEQGRQRPTLQALFDMETEGTLNYTEKADQTINGRLSQTGRFEQGHQRPTLQALFDMEIGGTLNYTEKAEADLPDSSQHPQADGSEQALRTRTPPPPDETHPNRGLLLGLTNPQPCDNLRDFLNQHGEIISISGSGTNCFLRMIAMTAQKRASQAWEKRLLGFDKALSVLDRDRQRPDAKTTSQAEDSRQAHVQNVVTQKVPIFSEGDSVKSSETIPWAKIGVFEPPLVDFFSKEKKMTPDEVKQGGTSLLAEALQELRIGAHSQHSELLGITMKDVLEYIRNARYRKADISLHDAYLFMALGYSTDAADTERIASFVENKGKYAKWIEKGFTFPEAAAYFEAGLKLKDMDQFKGSLIKPQDAKTYLESLNILDPQNCPNIGGLVEALRARGIALSLDFIKGPMTDSNLEGGENGMKQIGEGEFNTVYKGTYKLPDGKTFEGVYKEEKWMEDPNHRPATAVIGGIDCYRPLYGNRNIASYRLNRLLGFSVIPPATFGVHKGELGLVVPFVKGITPWRIETNEAGTGIEAAHLKIAAKKDKIEKDPLLAEKLAKKINASAVYVEDGKVMIRRLIDAKIDYNDPMLRRELIKLQLMDHLCGQLDRHCGNYIIQLNDKGAVTGITGIDNDQSFGSFIQHPNQVAKKYCLGTQLPLVIDNEMHEAFMSLEPEAIRRELSGLLNPEEIQATISRLDGIKKHFEHLKNTGAVIPETKWDSDEVSKRLEDRAYSYLGRDRTSSGKRGQFGRVANFLTNCLPIR